MKTEMFDDIIYVRRALYDPQAIDYIRLEEIPETYMPDIAVSVGDNGEWNHYTTSGWVKYPVKFTDEHIKSMILSYGKYQTAICFIDAIISRIDPVGFLHSANAGAQSMSFASLSDVINFYTARKTAIQEDMCIALKSFGGGHFRENPIPIGGEYNGCYT